MEEPRLYAIALLVVVFLITAASRKISRSLELANWVMVSAILIGLILIDLFIVPWRLWWEGIRGFVTPAMPPEGITATQLGGLAGFTALASGLNWYVMGHYRDKGYGMGHRAGHIAGLRGEQTQAARRRRHLPGRREEHRAVEALVQAAGDRPVGRLLHRRDARHAAADDPDGPRGRAVRREAHPGERAHLRRDRAGRGVRAGTVRGRFGPRRAHPLQHPARHLRGDGPGDHGRRARQQPAAARAHRGRPAALLLPVHVRAARDHQHHPALRAAGEPGAVVGEHVQPRRADLPVHAHVPELRSCPRRRGRGRSATSCWSPTSCSSASSSSTSSPTSSATRWSRSESAVAARRPGYRR